jgi:tetratricopeptide (TPR) repeat protein
MIFNDRGAWITSGIALIAVILTIPGQRAEALTADEKRCRDGKPDEVIRICTKLINSSTADYMRSIYLNNRALAWLAKQECDLAAADFEEAIRLEPDKTNQFGTNYYDLHLRLGGWVHAECKGDFDKAIAVASDAIRSSGKYAGGYMNRGSAYREKGDFGKALADYDKALTLADRNHHRIYNGRALVWRDMGELDKALADYDQAIRLDPRNPQYLSNRGEAWRLKGDLDRALNDQDRAVKLNPKHELALVLRGDTLRYKGDLQKAMNDYEAALRINKDYAPAFTGRGLVFEKMGEPTRARQEFEKALLARGNAGDVYKSARATAGARLAALNSGAIQPVIPAAPSKATSATSIPTPAIAVPPATDPAVDVAVAKAASGASVPVSVINLPSAVAPSKPIPAGEQSRRVALVIGNSAYTSVSPLLNPLRDAQAIAASLRHIGFDAVTLAADASREKLIDALRIFANESEKADWALVYYAGHGIEVNGVNYLIPVDARLAADRDVQFEAVPLDRVMAAVEGAKKLKLIILDACRDNPFAPQMRKTAAPGPVARADTAGGHVGTRSVGRGLAEVKVSAGSLVVYAAKHGQVALDGEGGNSPFAVALVQRIATPGVEINKVFRLIRDDVMEATAGRQEPFTYGSLPGREDFFFVAGKQ